MPSLGVIALLDSDGVDPHESFRRSLSYSLQCSFAVPRDRKRDRVDENPAALRAVTGFLGPGVRDGLKVSIVDHISRYVASNGLVEFSRLNAQEP